MRISSYTEVRRGRCTLGKHALSNHRCAERDPVSQVDAEHNDGHPANRRPTNQERSLPAKMPRPLVPPGMEEPHNPFRDRIHPRNVGTFETVAGRARQGQVGSNRRVAAKTGTYEIDSKGK